MLNSNRRYDPFGCVDPDTGKELQKIALTFNFKEEKGNGRNKRPINKRLFLPVEVVGSPASYSVGEIVVEFFLNSNGGMTDIEFVVVSKEKDEEGQCFTTLGLVDESQLQQAISFLKSDERWLTWDNIKDWFRNGGKYPLHELFK